MTKHPPKLTVDDDDVSGLVKAVGARLIEIRTSIGMSLNDLAEQAGMSRAYLYELESGGANFTLKTLGKMAIVLGVHARDIMPDPGAASLSPLTSRVVHDRLDRIHSLLAERQKQEVERRELDVVLIEELRAFSELPQLLEELRRLVQQAAKPVKSERKSTRSTH